MKKLLTLISIIAFSVNGFCQDIVKICDEMIMANNFDKVSSIIVNGGMVIEPLQNLYGYDTDLKIIASNGSQPITPTMCTVTAKSKEDRRIELISVVYNGNAGIVIKGLKGIGYEFLYSGTYEEGGFKFNYNVYFKPKLNITCKVSLPADGSIGALLEFHNEQ